MPEPMPDIVITEFMDEAAVETLKARFNTLYDPGLADRQGDIGAQLGECRALIVRNRTQVIASLLASGPQLQCVGRLGVGLDNIDLAACRNAGVAVYPANGANNLSVAEYVLANAMNLLRGAYLSSALVAQGTWPRQQLTGREISGKTLGLIGFGSIAQETAEKAIALGMKIVAHDPFLPDSHPAWVMAKNLSLNDLLMQSDVVSLHVPLTDETRHLIDDRAIGLMKRDAILINAARGHVVDEQALANALSAGELGGAALDVFETEPLTADAGAKFAGLSNLVLTPHIAGVTVESNSRVSTMIAGLVLRHLGEHA